MSVLAQAPSKLQPIPDLTFLEETHQYRFKGQTIPVSTTSVLSFDMDPSVRERIDATKASWAPRGTHVHNVLEQHLLGAAAMSHGDYGEWCEPLLSHPLWDRYKAIATEYRLVDKKMRYAGSLDFLLRGEDRNGKELTLLGDLKTKGNASSKVGDHKAQLGAYLSMLAQWHSDLWVDRCIVVNSFPGRVELTTYETQECLDAWDEQWGKYEAWQPVF